MGRTEDGGRRTEGGLANQKAGWTLDHASQHAAHLAVFRLQITSAKVRSVRRKYQMPERDKKTVTKTEIRKVES